MFQDEEAFEVKTYPLGFLKSHFTIARVSSLNRLISRVLDLSRYLRSLDFASIGPVPLSAFDFASIGPVPLSAFVICICPVICPAGNGDRWDQHGNLRDGHAKNCKTVDQPIAGLLKDLQGRGLLDDTLVVWAGEFGRTPFAQGGDGRDHNPFGFTVWLAGGGVKAGAAYGATDDWGYKAVENKCNIHDLHATILHLLGMDHLKSTFRFSGRDMRLTDVYGEIMTPIIA